MTSAARAVLPFTVLPSSSPLQPHEEGVGYPTVYLMRAWQQCRNSATSVKGSFSPCLQGLVVHSRRQPALLGTCHQRIPHRTRVT